MPGTSWQINGNYFEACSCDYPCPCVATGLTARPTKGFCEVPLVFHIERGQFDGVTLDGLNFVVVVHTPGVMAEGNWTVGVLTDDRASSEQGSALAKIASGEAGGPMSHLAPLIGTFQGVEARAIRVEQDGMRRSVVIPDRLEQTVEGVPGADPSEPMYLENVAHPAATRLALAKCSNARLHAFGIDWEDASGKNNGHFAPFSWRSE